MRANLDQQYIASLADYARSGDSDAFAELFMSTCQMQYRFALGYLKDEEKAKEAVRDTYVIVLKNIAALRDPNLFLSWLSQISFRVCLGLREKSRGALDKIPFYDEEELKRQPMEDLNPEECSVRIDGQEFIIRQVMSLPFTEAQVVILRYYNQLELWDSSRLMDRRTGTVTRHLANGRRKLRQLSKQH